MYGQIFLVLYVIIQTGMSVLTEYVISKNKHYKELGRKTRIFRIIIYVILAIIPVLGAFLPKSDFKYFCMRIGNVWFAFFMYYSGLVIFLTLILIIVSKIKKDDEGKLLGHVLNIALVISIGLAVYGLIHAQNPKIVNYDITLDKKSANISELKVVLIADLHLSVNSDVKLTEKMVEEVNSVNPDLIIIAGDIFTSNYEGLRNPEAYSAALSKMKAKYGIYAVAGNHDVDENLFSGFSISPVSEAFRTSEMDKFFSDCGFTMLYDESIEVADGNVVLVGRIDAEKAGDGTKNRMSAKLLLKNVDKSKPVFVLQHEPTEFKDLSENGADAVFSGHTHNGQVFPGNLVVPFFNENGYGVKELYGITTVVTAGVGYYGPPIRIGTDSEVTVVNILFQ
jgi:Predicted phosphohydrolases